jgi:hypothetical protein
LHVSKPRRLGGKALRASRPLSKDCRRGDPSLAAVLALGSFGVSVLRLRAQRKWVKAEREARAIDPPQNRRLWLEYEDRDGPDRKVG